MTIALVLLIILAVASLAGAVWLWSERGRLRNELHRSETASADLRAALDASIAEAASLEVHRARLDERLEAAREKEEEFRGQLDARLKEQHEAFRKVIEASAGDAMRQSARHLLDLAAQNFEKQQMQARAALDERVKPLSETLRRTEEKLGEIERERLGAYASLTQQITHIAAASEVLRKETGNLVASLRRPHVRGKYGEIQLRRVAELAGMRDYCDFVEQESGESREGSLRRPDMIVRLPNERCVIIDAKTNIDAYLTAIESPDESSREAALDRFAEHVSAQAAALSRKEYWTQFKGAADLVVMFIPGDQFIDAALQRRPDLLERAAENRVILASPSTLIGLLRAVFVGWRERNLSHRADELFSLGKELHKRIGTVLEPFIELGKHLNDASLAYNEAVGSIDARLMPTLRRFENAEARSERTIADPPLIETRVRALRAATPQGSSEPHTA